MKPIYYLLSLILLFPGMSIGQVRYLDEVFSEVTVTEDVYYATNISIVGIVLGLSEEPGPEELYMDVYEPKDDTETERPVVIFAHRGDFLPAIINQTPYGTKGDSAVVEVCMEMAKRGYVAISMGYRLGWNPFGNDQEMKSGVLQAAYRLSQDMHALVRFLRYDAAEQGNTYRIDSDKIAVGGFDSAAWGATTMAYLKNVTQVDTLVKFVDLGKMPPEPFIIEAIHGNPQGTNQAFLNVPNYPGYSSEISAVINLSGGIGDLSWVEAGDPPIIGLQTRGSYNGVGIRDVTLTAGGPIIIPTGAFLDTIVHKAHELGNQDLFIDKFPDDELTQMALDSTGGLEGLLLYDGFKVNQTVLCDPTPGADSSSYGGNGYPWNWYDEATFGAIWDGVPNQTIPSQIYICGFNAREGNPNDPAIAKTFIRDTMMNYIPQRLCVAMGLGCFGNATLSWLKSDLDFKAFPNPTSHELTFQANSAIREIRLFDLNGRVIYRVDGLNDQQRTISVQHYTPGLYIASVRFDQGVVSEKVVVR